MRLDEARADEATARGVETAEVRTYTQEEVDKLLADAGAALPNPAPAIEEGPHLQDPEVRAAKRKQLQDAGVDADHPDLTDDMRALMRETD